MYLKSITLLETHIWSCWGMSRYTLCKTFPPRGIVILSYFMWFQLLRVVNGHSQFRHGSFRAQLHTHLKTSLPNKWELVQFDSHYLHDSLIHISINGAIVFIIYTVLLSTYNTLATPYICTSYCATMLCSLTDNTPPDYISMMVGWIMES